MSSPKASIRGKVAVIGIGMSPVGKVPGRSALWLSAKASLAAISDAGLTKQDIDGVLCSHAFASPFHRFSIALSEYMGIAPTFSNTLQVSGATAATMFNVGAAIFPYPTDIYLTGSIDGALNTPNLGVVHISIVKL